MGRYSEIICEVAVPQGANDLRSAMKHTLNRNISTLLCEFDPNRSANFLRAQIHETLRNKHHPDGYGSIYHHISVFRHNQNNNVVDVEVHCETDKLHFVYARLSEIAGIYGICPISKNGLERVKIRHDLV